MTESKQMTDESKKASPRKPTLAFFLSLFLPGLGQFYNGRALKGLAALSLIIGSSLFFWQGLGLLADFGFPGFVFSQLVRFGLRLAVASEAYLEAKKLGDFIPSKRDQAWVYILVIVAYLGLAWLVVPLVEPFLVQNAPVRIFYYPSGSMNPTLRTGDSFLSDARGQGEWVRGMIVTARVSEDLEIVKRIAALPGETIAIVDGRCQIDGIPLDTPYWAEDANENFEPWMVPDGQVFLLGDNINHSNDSRYIGAVPMEALTGVVLFRIWGRQLGTDLTVDWERP